MCEASVYCNATLWARVGGAEGGRESAGRGRESAELPGGPLLVVRRGASVFRLSRFWPQHPIAGVSFLG